MASRIEQLQQFLQQSPNDPFLNHALALEWIKAGDDQQAEQAFRSNLDRSPEYVATYYHLGKLLERVGHNDDAMSLFERGMTVARAAGDMHTYSELQSAYEDLAY